MTQVIPAPLAIRNLFEDLLGREVNVSDAPPPVAEDLNRTVVAVYVDDRLQLAGVIGLDLPLAAYAGAALGLLPPGGAQDCVEDKVLSSVLAENVTELCNVLTGLLNREGAAHTKLYKLSLPGESVANDAAALLLALGRRLDLKVEVSRYGSGRFSLSLAS